MKLSIILVFIIVFTIKSTAQSKDNVQNNNIGWKIKGDFNGDGKIETAQLVKTKEGFGNPIEDGTSDEYEIQFSNKKINSIKIGCCEAKLINEGDLNNDGKDEISVYQAPMNGCTYTMKTYTFTKLGWKYVVEPFLISNGCDDLPDEKIKNLVFKKNNSIYYYTTNPNNGKLTKQKVKK